MILDAGSGHNPHPQADILCDLFVTPTAHRAGSLTTLGKPFVCADIRYLPFRAQAFKVVYCSHVLEHTPQPQQVFEELKRVGEHGVIKFPTRFWELMFWAPGYSLHLWALKPSQNSIQANNVFTGFSYAFKSVIPRIIKMNFRIKLRERLFPLLRRFYETTLTW